MAKISILIVEDEPLYADLLQIQVEEMGYEPSGIADNALDGMSLFHEKQPDLILMDINLADGGNGITLATKIQSIRPTPIIFITSLVDDDTFQKAAKTLPVAYLEKPVRVRKLQRTIELVVSRLGLGNEDNNKDWGKDLLIQDRFFVKVRNRLEKVEVKSIDYVEVENRYCSLFTDHRKYVVRMALQDLANKLPQHLFMQTHRSFMVNLEKVNSLDLGEGLLYVGEKGVPLGKTYKDSVMKRLNYLA
ncbi:MAG: response regulator [Bacteroidia bacterium]|nr:response regulator [Bacteroidia bacterium]